jgi:hypothetical protein
MSLFTGLPTCNDVQTAIENVYDEANQAQSEALPFLGFVTSYSSPMAPVIAPGSGKVLGVEVQHQQPLNENNVSETSERGCIATRKPAMGSTLYEIDPNDILTVDMLFQASDLTRWCGSNPALFAKEIDMMWNAMNQKVARRLAEDAVLLNGLWSADVADTFTVDGNENLELATKLSGGAINPEMLVDLNFAVRDLQGYSAPYVVAGGNSFHRYIKLAEQGCCTNTGLQLDGIFREYGYASIYDRRLKEELANIAGATDAMVVQAGAIQMLNYVQADWSTGIPFLDARASNYVTMVLRHPVFGYAVELTIKDECRGKISVIMDTVVKFVGPPTTLYRPDDDRNGVNWIAKLKEVNP